MAACLSPSPSGRRLSELLEEQQEPFFLDIHLLEKGCSTRLLDAYDGVPCWPGGEGWRLKRLASGRKNKRSPRIRRPSGGVLRFLLSKILHGKAAGRKPALPALQWEDAGKKAFSETDAEENVDDDDDYDDDEDAKQLSPVSVLGHHPFEKAMMQDSPKNALHIFRELMAAAYTPALLDRLLAESDELIRGKDSALDDGDRCYCMSPENSGSDEATTGATADYWELYRAELGNVNELIASEIPGARLDASDVLPQRRDVGADIADAVLKQLREELVMELLHMDHATASRCCC